MTESSWRVTQEGWITVPEDRRVVGRIERLYIGSYVRLDLYGEIELNSSPGSRFHCVFRKRSLEGECKSP